MVITLLISAAIAAVIITPNNTTLQNELITEFMNRWIHRLLKNLKAISYNELINSIMYLQYSTYNTVQYMQYMLYVQYRTHST